MPRFITLHSLKCFAAGLLSEGDERPGYYWAIVDLVISASGLNHDQFNEVAAELESIRDRGLCLYQGGGKSVPRWTKARRERRGITPEMDDVNEWAAGTDRTFQTPSER
jgi:hypothetical protein